MAQFANSNRYGGRMNAFWIEPAKKDVNGYALKNVDAGVQVPQGYPLYCVENQGKKEAYVCKYIKVISVANDNKTLTVEKHSLAKAGEKYYVSGADSAVLRTISSVTEGQTTDTIVLSAAAAEITDGAILVNGAASGSSSSASIAPVRLPNRVCAQYAKVDALDATISAAHSAVVLKNIVNYPEEYINNTTFPGTDLLVGCPLVMFIVQ